MQRISGVVLTYVHVTDAARSRACVISRVSDRLAGLLLRPGGGHRAAGERDERVRRQLDATKCYVECAIDNRSGQGPNLTSGDRCVLTSGFAARACRSGA